MLQAAGSAYRAAREQETSGAEGEFHRRQAQMLQMCTREFLRNEKKSHGWGRWTQPVLCGVLILLAVLAQQFRSGGYFSDDGSAEDQPVLSFVDDNGEEVQLAKVEMNVESEPLVLEAENLSIEDEWKDIGGIDDDSSNLF